MYIKGLYHYQHNKFGWWNFLWNKKLSLLVWNKQISVHYRSSLSDHWEHSWLNANSSTIRELSLHSVYFLASFISSSVASSESPSPFSSSTYDWNVTQQFLLQNELQNHCKLWHCTQTFLFSTKIQDFINSFSQIYTFLEAYNNFSNQIK